MSTVIADVTTLPQGVDTQVFCYDDLARLTWAGSRGTPACSGAPTPSDTGALAGSTAAYSATYAYDTMNRLTSSPLGTYAYGDSAHADAATTIGAGWSASYDAAGDMTCRNPSSASGCAGPTPSGGATLLYDNQGQLASWRSSYANPSSVASFLYDGEGNRVEQVATCGGALTTTTYIGSLEEIAVTGATTTTTASYGGLALSVNGALSYTLSDGLGSVSAAVGADGTTIVTQLYGPYGQVRYSSGSLPGTRAYTGQRADAATGLDYYNARYYDPLAGQFTSADTADAGGLNRYGYVGGSPETRTDPSGHRMAQPHDYSVRVEYDEWSAQASHTYFSASRDLVADTGQFLLGTDTLSQSYHTIFLDPHATTGDKARAAGVATLTVVSDVVAIGSLFIGDPEVGDGARALDEALLAGDEAKAAAATTDATLDATLTTATDAGTETTAAAGDAICGGLSFSADTLVATPSGERPIASLAAGDQVRAFNPTTGTTTTQRIVRVFLNHDHDRLDVTLDLPRAQRATTAAQARPARDAETAREQARRVAGHGLRAPPDASTTVSTHAASSTGSTSATEVIHTTANHPWLTADHGWLVAGDLRVGEPVRLLAGGTATVVALRTLPGVGAMWDLSLDSMHTFAVGDVQAVVHNCSVEGTPAGTEGDLTRVGRWMSREEHEAMLQTGMV